jgi:hypothetical protein
MMGQEPLYFLQISPSHAQIKNSQHVSKQMKIPGILQTLDDIESS